MKKLSLLAIGLGLSIALGATPKNTFVIMDSSQIDTLDPSQAYDVPSYRDGIEHMYETLYGYVGHSADKFAPLLASAMPTISNGGKTYTVPLRKGVKFHSGNTMSCDDVQYSVRRSFATNSEAWGAITRNSFFSVNDAADMKKIPWSKVENAIQCPTQDKVVFNLAKPDATFLSKLAFSAMVVLDKDLLVKNGEWSGTEKDWLNQLDKDLHTSFLGKTTNTDAGTGPYQLVQRSDSQLVYKAFAGYWGKKPAIENVIVRYVPEQAARATALLAGDADFIQFTPRANLEQLKGGKGVKIIDGLAVPNSLNLLLNQKIAAESPALGSGKLDGNGIPTNFFSDKNLRIAFNYSFDQDRYLQEVLLGKGVVRTMALPHFFLGYDANLPRYKFDKDKATEYFKKAWGGQVWDKGFTLTAYYGANAVSTQILMELFKKNIESINAKFKINVQAVPLAEMIKLSSQGKTAIAAFAWIADFADPDNYIDTFYHSKGFYSPRLNYSNPKMDKLIEQARSTTNLATRKKLYRDIGQLAYEDAPLILTPGPVNYIVTRDEVKGIEENYNTMYTGYFLWKNVQK